MELDEGGGEVFVVLVVGGKVDEFFPVIIGIGETRGEGFRDIGCELGRDMIGAYPRR